MGEKCARIALGGVFSGLCLLLMFLSSVLPFTEYAMPMLAGAALAVVVIENGVKTALLVYVSVSLLSVFIVPDINAKIAFIAFFGYYAVLKLKLEGLRVRWVEMLCKLLVFNVAMAGGYYAAMRLLGTGEAIEESGLLGRYGPPALLFAGNIAVVMYDFLLTRYISLYINWFRPTFLRRR